VIRYIEDNRALAERAIGTWVDPNALGGVLAIASTIVAPQIFAARPVLRYRWLTILVFGVLALALFLTYSRASLLAFGAGLVVIGALRYRKILLLMAMGLVIVLLLPQTQPLVERFVDAFTAQDLATQMRIGEYTDSFRLISRYPVFGVGFTGTPDIDLYTDVASMYLIMANQIGLTGVVIFAVAMMSVFGYGLSAWKHVKHNLQLDAIFLGYYAALVAALVNAVADLYFFRLDFHASITLFWSVVALALASAHLALVEHESTVAKTRPRL
ncbi:MAG: O-antigen ligase family protein, partial [Anaerolineae bacterium]|nr:O-antigen ligase family protein [Anaerolineae bacterium]